MKFGPTPARVRPSRGPAVTRREVVPTRAPKRKEANDVVHRLEINGIPLLGGFR